MLDANAPNGSTCRICEQVVTQHPIKASVGAGGKNSAADVLVIQQYLNSVLPANGGPNILLAEDGKMGQKTQAAITKYQQAALGWSDGRIDPADKTIKALTNFICDSPTVQPGKLGLPATTAAGTPNTATPASSTLAADSILVAQSCCRVMEPRLHDLRFKMTRMSPDLVALMNKHFATNGKNVDNNDIEVVRKTLQRIHFNMARANAFGKFQFENVIQFDSKPPGDTVAYTVRGGDKLTTKQFQIYRDKVGNKEIEVKLQGQTLWLTSLFADQPREEKHWSVLHEFCHYVGPRDGNVTEINDYAYAKKPEFRTLSKFQKMHNAESLAFFFLEWCFGTDRVCDLPRIAPHKAHYSNFPKVKVPGFNIVMS